MLGFGATSQFAVGELGGTGEIIDVPVAVIVFEALYFDARIVEVPQATIQFVGPTPDLGLVWVPAAEIEFVQTHPQLPISLPHADIQLSAFAPQIDIPTISVPAAIEIAFEAHAPGLAPGTQIDIPAAEIVLQGGAPIVPLGVVIDLPVATIQFEAGTIHFGMIGALVEVGVPTLIPTESSIAEAAITEEEATTFFTLEPRINLHAFAPGIHTGSSLSVPSAEIHFAAILPEIGARRRSVLIRAIAS